MVTLDIFCSFLISLISGRIFKLLLSLPFRMSTQSNFKFICLLFYDIRDYLGSLHYFAKIEYDQIKLECLNYKSWSDSEDYFG